MNKNEAESTARRVLKESFHTCQSIIVDANGNVYANADAKSIIEMSGGKELFAVKGEKPVKTKQKDAE